MLKNIKNLYSSINQFMTYLFDDRGRIFSLLTHLPAISENHIRKHTISSFDGYFSCH
jgi:hypothetical protein